MDIAAYAGEFTVSPIPLEMSMNYCSHKCGYCFANLNQPNRKLDVNRAINQIKNCHKSKGLTSYLLANGYPVLLSNRVDPFATTNYRQTLSFIDLFNANGNKIAFQTKGGEGIDQALSNLDYKASWYISIGFWNDNYRSLIEPGAPTIQQRIELAERLISLGHHVSIGINPLVEQWLPVDDFENLAERLKEIGVKDVWIEVLHLNSKQVGNMSAKEKTRIGGDVIGAATKRSRDISYFMYCHNELRDMCFNVFSIGQPFQSNYFDGYHKLYEGKTLRTHQDFINYCFEKYPNGGEIKFQEYYDFMGNPFYSQLFSEADGYAYRIARNVYKRMDNTPYKTLKDVLKFYWENEEVSKSLSGNALFSVCCYKEDGEIIPWECKEHGMLIYYFHAEAKNVYTHILE